MNHRKETKRLFFAAEVTAPWPHELPQGRLIEESSRHLTLAFLGNTSWENLKNILNEMPQPPFRISPVGYCSELLFLPKKTPRVVSCHVKWWTCANEIEMFQHALCDWLRSKGYVLPQKEDRFLSHVTLARAPFIREEWNMAPLQIPFVFKAIHVYESIGNLVYQPLWSHPLLAPFEEFEHTADIAFVIRGETIQELFLHAQIALAFKYPPLVSYCSLSPSLDSLDDIVIALNQIVSRVDEEIGSPFKAISFHGEILEKEHYLEWEMIVDV